MNNRQAMVIDTSSLYALVTYYRHFDGGNIVYSFIERLFQNGDLILLESVQKEAHIIAKSCIVEDLVFLDQKENRIKTIKNIPVTTQKTHKKIDNHWCRKKTRKYNFNQEDYEDAKKEFIESADCQLILYSLEDDRSTVVVTEESRSENDSKMFKKIPLICDREKIECINLPRMLKYFGLEVEYRIARPAKPLS